METEVVVLAEAAALGATTSRPETHAIRTARPTITPLLLDHGLHRQATYSEPRRSIPRRQRPGDPVASKGVLRRLVCTPPGRLLAASDPPSGVEYSLKRALLHS